MVVRSFYYSIKMNRKGYPLVWIAIAGSKSEFTVFWIERIIVNLVGYYMNYSAESSSKWRSLKRGIINKGHQYPKGEPAPKEGKPRHYLLLMCQSLF